MAKHWSSEVCVLCWSDPKSGMRRRMSWGSREHCEKLAAEVGDDAEPVLYSGFDRRLPIRPGGGPTAKPKPKPRKRKPAVAVVPQDALAA